MSSSPAQITAGLWVFPSRSMNYNAGVFLRDGRALLIDPGPHPDETDAIAAFVAERGAAVAMIVLTHSHWDHILGPERLPPAPIVAQARYPETVARDREIILREVARWDAQNGHERTAPLVIPTPDRLIGDVGELEFAGARLQIMHIPGHANDQLAIFCPDEGWLWAADTLSDCEIPFINESLSEYEATIERLSAVPAGLAVPGHGRPALTPADIAARVAEDRDYLARLRAGVESALASGGNLDAAKAACAGLRLKNEAENRGEHRVNVESVFIALGGAADPDQFGWKQRALSGG
ncbi:MBL fold metallo-hydrolase [Oscillochloris sp. ZM17-4]|uniref:MBL fold metallo-hydrolase n=1 Tax=Oscillochloris sp. ZM17-4 TaxID=2866714 RepID=UPI001C734B0D|nr:MBL fold metallo-hydrolase [Oscillochloris sp. ZM17-4]MBX0330147.1 MBL fold metallo-hydrolase [Oscillochloris sp. ZM17-4]